MRRNIDHELNKLAHTDLDGLFSFEIAIRLCKNYLCVRRKGWAKGKTYITISALESGSEINPIIKDIIGEYIPLSDEYEDESERHYRRYRPTDADFFTDDWYVIDPDEFYKSHFTL